MKTSVLKARYDHAQSFYGKARTFVIGETVFLQSYNTIVCSIDKSGEVKRYWEGYSNTTMRHVNEFLKQYGIDKSGKKYWESLEVVNL